MEVVGVPPRSDAIEVAPDEVTVPGHNSATLYYLSTPKGHKLTMGKDHAECRTSKVTKNDTATHLVYINSDNV